MAGGTLLVLTALLLVPSMNAGKRPKVTAKPLEAPDLEMDGGRRLTFERSFSLEREVKPKRSFWTRVVDTIAGQPDFHYLVSPYSVVTDSRGRIIVSDVAAAGIHIFDFEQQKYKFVSRRDAGKDPMLTPQCVAVDAQDNIYVTDSQAGKIFVFDANGKFRRTIGSLKGGEGYFKRPTGIAVDSAAQHIYVSDTLRNKVFMLDMQGSVLQAIGKSGTGDGEFNFPTEVKLNGQDLAVVDAMNFRVQVFDRSGRSAMRSEKLAMAPDGFFVRRELASIQNRTSMWWMGSGALCRRSMNRGNCCITLAVRGPGRNSSSCLRASRSTSMTASM